MLAWKQGAARHRGLRARQGGLALARNARALLRCSRLWRQHAAATSSALRWRLHTFQRRHARAQCIHTMVRMLAAWKQHVMPGMQRHVATRRVALVLRGSWQRWRHRIATARTVGAKYAACARRHLATARDMGFVARAAWRNGLRAKRAKVASFQKRLRLHTLWVVFEVLVRPLVLRNNMNEMCLRRHIRRLRDGFDGFVAMQKLCKLRLLEFEMQAHKDCAAALDRLVTKRAFYADAPGASTAAPTHHTFAQPHAPDAQPPSTATPCTGCEASTAAPTPVATHDTTAQPHAPDAKPPSTATPCTGCEAPTAAPTHNTTARPRAPDAQRRVTVPPSMITALTGYEAPWLVTFDLPTHWHIPRPAQTRVCMDIPGGVAAKRASEQRKPMFCARAQTAHPVGTVYETTLYSPDSACHARVLPLRADDHVQRKAQDMRPCYPQHISQNVTMVQCILCGWAQVVLALTEGLDATVQAAVAAGIAGCQVLPPRHWVGQALYLGARISPHNLGTPPEQVVRSAVDFLRVASEDIRRRSQPLALYAVRQVVHSIQAVRGCKSAGVPKDTLIWWAAMTETTVRWHKLQRLHCALLLAFLLSLHALLACTGGQRGQRA